MRTIIRQDHNLTTGLFDLGVVSCGEYTRIKSNLTPLDYDEVESIVIDVLSAVGHLIPSYKYENGELVETLD